MGGDISEKKMKRYVHTKTYKVEIVPVCDDSRVVAASRFNEAKETMR